MTVLSRYTAIISLLLAGANLASAQGELPVTTGEFPSRQQPDSLKSYLQPVTSPEQPEVSSEASPSYEMQRLYDIESTLSLPSVFAPRPLTSRSSVIALPGIVGFGLWDGASVTVSGNSVSLPGMLGIESGRISFNQQFGRFNLSLYGEANKYGYFRGLQTGYGFGGQLSYRVSDRLSLTVFGSYATPFHPLTPAMAGYTAAPNFGGYATIDISDHWGINVGAQATRSLVTNRWEAQPIVMPYYKINGKAAIGVDVGGILYNVFKNYSTRHDGHMANPTIGPPVGGPPPVAPHPGR